MPIPGDIRLDDGFSSVITFDLDPTIALWEKRIKPFGLDAGGPTPVTTMRNISYRTQSPKKLLSVTAMTGRCAYDPQVFDYVVALMGRNGIVTTTFPDTCALSAYGWLDKFDPDELQEGVQPEATFTIEPSIQSTIGGDESGLVVLTRAQATSTTTTTTTTTP